MKDEAITLCDHARLSLVVRQVHEAGMSASSLRVDADISTWGTPQTCSLSLLEDDCISGDIIPLKKRLRDFFPKTEYIPKLLFGRFRQVYKDVNLPYHNTIHIIPNT